MTDGTVNTTKEHEAQAKPDDVPSGVTEMTLSVQERYERLEKTVRDYNPQADFDLIRRAYEFAEKEHRGQLRKSGEPYIIHPIAVAQIIAELKLDSESLAAALLHDVIEDTPATHADVSRLFSPTIADLVEGVSKLTRIQYDTVEDEQMENFRKMLMAMNQDMRVDRKSVV